MNMTVSTSASTSGALTTSTLAKELMSLRKEVESLSELVRGSVRVELDDLSKGLTDLRIELREALLTPQVYIEPNSDGKFPETWHDEAFEGDVREFKPRSGVIDPWSEEVK